MAMRCITCIYWSTKYKRDHKLSLAGMKHQSASCWKYLINWHGTFNKYNCPELSECPERNGFPGRSTEFPERSQGYGGKRLYRSLTGYWMYVTNNPNPNNILKIIIRLVILATPNILLPTWPTTLTLHTNTAVMWAIKFPASLVYICTLYEAAA